MATIARSPVDVILGEAGGKTAAQRYADMVAIASVIQNRAMTGKVSHQDVVAVQSQFNAYGKALPAGTEAYRGLAEMAMRQVMTQGPVHNATYYATDKAKGNLPSGLQQQTKTENGHVYFSDPQQRSFATAQGYVQPASYAPQAQPATAGQALETLAAPSPGRGMAALAPNGLRYDALPTTNVAGLNWDGRTRAETKGVVAHHTGGRGTPAGVVNTLNQRGFGAHYTIDREGRVHQLAPTDARLSHVRGRGVLNNTNTIGVEIIAKDDSDITPAQAAAFASLTGELNAQYPGLDVVGHGQLPGQVKQETEGLTATNAYWGSMLPSDNAPVPASRDVALAAAQTSPSARQAESESMATLGNLQAETADSRVAQAFDIGGPLGVDVASLTQQEPTQASAFGLPSLVSTAQAAPNTVPGREPPAPFDMHAARPSARRAEDESMAALAQLQQELAQQQALPALPSREVRDLPVAAIDESLPPQTLPATVAPIQPPAPAGSIPAASRQNLSAPSTPTGMNAIAGTFGAPQGTTAKSAWGDNTFTSLGDGRVSFTNEYGHTRTLSPEDYGFPDTMSRPAAQAQQQVEQNVNNAQRGFMGIPEASKGIGGMARGFGGGLAGGMIGGLLGPVGGLLGSYLGSQIAAGKNPFSMGGNRLATSLGRPVSALSPNELSGLLSRNYTPGLSFPNAPTGGVLSGNAPSFGDMASISPAAAAAISDGRAGLY